ncbi:hypothetical protein CCAX7_004760 [Capsulimonas corticalis]|uniref:Uncharacterized protein n=1 Tax=Capsulimonas corticalis TaxID=2219043 RepID=A0A402D2W8_9BACT|nr:hypothetical protein [Capsulimonas corticalis]BDI28425.1 hypothetical protein CCAX7_004760 [Capsulimonas corticalis]
MDSEIDFSSLGVAGALSQMYRQDTQGFLPLIAVFLEGALPAETRVERAGGLFRKTKPVVRVTTTIGENIYVIEDSRGALATRREKVVRGIRLKSEELAIHQWLGALSEDVAERAASDEAAMAAMRRLLE